MPILCYALMQPRLMLGVIDDMHESYAALCADLMQDMVEQLMRYVAAPIALHGLYHGERVFCCMVCWVERPRHDFAS